MDFDDTQLSTTPDRIFGLLTHPTLPPLAAALAIGERRHVSGARLPRGLPHRVRGRVQDRGGDPSESLQERLSFVRHHRHVRRHGRRGEAARSRCGRDGARDRDRGEPGAGIRVNFGTMTKPLHVGRAAQNGVMAAELAARRLHRRRTTRWTGPGASSRCSASAAASTPIASSGSSGSRTASSARASRSSRIRAASSVIRAWTPCASWSSTTTCSRSRFGAIRLRAGSNILNPLRYPIAHERARGQVLSGVHAVEHRASAESRHSRVHRRVRAQRAGAADDGARCRPSSIPTIEARGFDKIRSTVEVDLEDGTAADRRTPTSDTGAGPIGRSRVTSCTRSSPSARRSCLPPSAIAETLAAVEALEELSDVRDLVGCSRRLPA